MEHRTIVLLSILQLPLDHSETRKQQNQPRHMEQIGSLLTTAPPPPNQKTAKPAETHGKNRLPLDHSAASPKPENSKISRDTWKNRLPLDHSPASPKPENSKTSRDTWKKQAS